jgi:hypothetical protein
LFYSVSLSLYVIIPAMLPVSLLDVIERVLHRREDGWLFLRELRVGTGRHTHQAQRLDAFALNSWPHTGMKRVCYEVKLSRADFLCELKHPLKRRIGMRYSNEFYFVTTPGLLRVSEVPPECGWLEVDCAKPDFCTVAIPAPWRDTPGPTWQLVAAMLRHQRRELEERPPDPPRQERLVWE